MREYEKRGAFGARISVHVSPGLRRADTVDHREDVSSFGWVRERGM